MGKKKKILLILAVGCMILGLGIFTGIRIAQRGRRPSELILVAHRAGAARAPENTVAALEQAILDGAHMAEIDVQELKDGTLIVMHDSNFRRTAGADRNVWDVEYGEVEELDAGAAFSGQFAGERVPTLEEMLECARGRILLMIEVKHTGHEKGVERSLVEQLDKMGMERQCVVGSMDLEILKRVKELNPGLVTVYIAHVLEEEAYYLPFVDSYSVEARNLTPETVERLHGQGKIVYGWTVNTRQGMRLLASCGADGLITDDVALAKRFHPQFYLCQL